MTAPIVHVGLPKTGSTFTQRIVFPAFQGFGYLTTDNEGDWPEELRWVYRVNKDHDRITSLSRLFHRKVWSESARAEAVESTRLFAEKAEKPLLLSSEGLCGVSYAPHRNAVEIAELLHRGFGPCRMILVFREQASWASSIYRQLVYAEDRFRTYVPFDRIFGFRGDSGALSVLEDLDWSVIVEAYQRIHGAENVLALPYEILRDDPARFAARIADFCGVDYRLPEGAAQRRIRESETVSIYGGAPDTRFEGLPADLRERIQARLAPANRRLARLTGFDLEALGYKCAPDQDR